jgi:hypothetical protein
MGELIDLNSQIPDSRIPSLIARDTETTAAIAAHVAAADPHPTYLTQTEGDGLYRARLTALTDVDIPATIARDTEITAAIAAHVAAADPHPTYLTQTEGDGLYRARLTALTDVDIPATIARDTEITAAIAAHVAIVDPHPVYLTQAEGDGRYPVFTQTIIETLTPATQGAVIWFAHGLVVTKIQTITSLINVNLSNAAGFMPFIPPGGLIGLPGYFYTIHVEMNNICLRLHATDSANILSKSIKVVVGSVL